MNLRGMIPVTLWNESESMMYDLMVTGFDSAVGVTWDWLKTPGAKRFYFKQGQRLSTFFKESGIHDEWQNLIDNRARMGADMVEQIYDYARQVQMEDHILPYTEMERASLNRLCDYNYELIRNVTQDEITAIRRQLVSDYAEGVYPLRTSLKQLQLEPINGFSPERRAEMIARTETARTLNTSTLEVLRGYGIERVVLDGEDAQCDECQRLAEEPVSIDEALRMGVPHPNCRCSWVPAEGERVR